MKIANSAKAFLLGLVLVSAACSSDSSDSKNNDSETHHEVAKETTDTRICNQAATTPPSVFQTWYSQEATSDGLQFDTWTSIEPNAMEVRVTCMKGLTQATVQVRVNAAVTANTIEVLSNGQDSDSSGSGSNKLNCGIDVRAGTKMNYTFQGPCLKAGIGSETRLMVPGSR